MKDSNKRIDTHDIEVYDRDNKNINEYKRNKQRKSVKHRSNKSYYNRDHDRNKTSSERNIIQLPCDCCACDSDTAFIKQRHEAKETKIYTNTFKKNNKNNKKRRNELYLPRDKNENKETQLVRQSVQTHIKINNKPKEYAKRYYKFFQIQDPVCTQEKVRNKKQKNPHGDGIIQKVDPGRYNYNSNKFFEVGLYTDAANKQNFNHICDCIKGEKHTTREGINTSTEHIKKNVEELRRKVISLCEKCSQILKQKKVKLQKGQTCEPFFEIKVDPNKMCVLNSSEIRSKVVKLNRNVRDCVCPLNDYPISTLLERGNYKENTNMITDEMYNNKKDTKNTTPTDKMLHLTLQNSCKMPIIRSCIPQKPTKKIFNIGNDHRYRRHRRKHSFSYAVQSNSIVRRIPTLHMFHRRSNLNFYVPTTASTVSTTRNTDTRRFPYEVNNNGNFSSRCKWIVQSSLSLLKCQQDLENIQKRIQTEKMKEGFTEKLKTKQQLKSELNKIKNDQKKNLQKMLKKAKMSKIKEKEFLKKMNRNEKLAKKRERLAHKKKLQEIKTLQREMEQESDVESNFCAYITLEFIKLITNIVKVILWIIFKLITEPKGSLWYIRERLKEPGKTWTDFKRWFITGVKVSRLRMVKKKNESRTLSVLSDTFRETDFYQSIAPTGITAEEKMLIEASNKRRRKRIQKRQHEAIYGCRHILLTTLRRTPCLCAYHICPNCYPQLLAMLSFMKNFFNLILFALAFVAWTPCIVSFELCRAIFCCVFCTQ